MNLKKRIVLSFGASFLIFLVFVTAIVISGLNISIKGWFRASEAEYTESISVELEKLLEAETDITPAIVREAVTPFVDNRFSLIIFSAAGNILFADNLPENISNAMRRPEPGTGMGMMMQEHRLRPGAAKMLLQNYPHNIFPVKQDGKTELYIWTKTTAFTAADSINRRFFFSILLTLVLGVTVSGGVALFSTYLISGRIAREAEEVSSGLKKLASGSREVAFPDRGSEEILSISSSADILQKKLISGEEARKQWTQDIAHDLRTPTSAIKAQLEAVIDGVFKPDRKRLSILLDELESLETLIEDINRLTFLESPEAKPNFAPVTSDYLCSFLKERFSMAALEKNIILEFESDSFTIICDQSLVSRALSNIVNNSIQYSPEKSTVNISFRKSGGNAVISVINPGKIPEQELEKVFNRLYRGEFGRASKGSGLGLTIADAAVKLHKGTLTAENTVFRGKDSVKITAAVPLNNKTAE